MFRMKRPAHPGEVFRYEVLEVHGLSITAAAEALGVTRAALSALVNGRSALSPEMALRIEKVFDLPMDVMLRVQAAYDAAAVRAKEGELKLTRFVA